MKLFLLLAIINITISIAIAIYCIAEKREVPDLYYEFLACGMSFAFSYEPIPLDPFYMMSDKIGAIVYLGCGLFCSVAILLKLIKYLVRRLL